MRVHGEQLCWYEASHVCVCMVNSCVGMRLLMCACAWCLDG